MSPSARKQRRSFARFLCIATAVTILPACSWSTRPSPPPDPLIAVSCPPLTQLNDDSFGATTLKLIEVSGQYYRCREAALGKQQEKQK